MRSLITVALLAGVCGPFAGPAFAADLDYPPPPPPPYYEPHPVPPAFVPGPVPPVYYRVRPRPIVYPRPYRVYAPPPVVRVYGEPRPYAEGGYDRLYPPREPRPYAEREVRPGYAHEAEVYRRERESYGEPRGIDRGDQRYGHYLSREELDRRAERDRGYDRDRYADRGRGYERDDQRDRFAERAPLRDYDR